MNGKRSSLDPLVKLGLGVFIGGFLMIGIGMFLSRPDRTIPPYSIGAQDGAAVAVHVPPWTSDPEIEALVRRFGEVGRRHNDFATMKIRPTTPDDPRGRYQRMTLYIFSDHEWADEQTLRRYVAPSDGREEEKAFKAMFDATVRGGYAYDASSAKGWLGPVEGRRVGQTNSPVQWLFREQPSTEHENHSTHDG